MNKDLLINLKHRKDAYKRSKQGEVTQKEYRDVARLCRDGNRKGKAHLEFNLVDNKEKLGKMWASC